MGSILLRAHRGNRAHSLSYTLACLDSMQFYEPRVCRRTLPSETSKTLHNPSTCSHSITCTYRYSEIHRLTICEGLFHTFADSGADQLEHLIKAKEHSPSSPAIRIRLERGTVPQDQIMYAQTSHSEPIVLELGTLV